MKHIMWIREQDEFGEDNYDTQLSVLEPKVIPRLGEFVEFWKDKDDGTLVCVKGYVVKVFNYYHDSRRSFYTVTNVSLGYRR